MAHIVCPTMTDCDTELFHAFVALAGKTRIDQSLHGIRGEVDAPPATAGCAARLAAAGTSRERN